jgi:hypothetical protein
LQTPFAQCPMCKQVVDPEHLKKFGYMNTRMQEKFCQSHQKKSAYEEWKTKGYPDIDWTNLDSRIASHHSFIKKVITGADSHYRRVLEDNVRSGKERNLLKSTTNLTPGYYGNRGLRAISENIMQEFTPLLKKKAVKDKVMAARGVTGFVQSVIVPEVAVLLIKEDMDVEVEEARDILANSADIGELVHDEIRDVVTRRVNDSEAEDGSD